MSTAVATPKQVAFLRRLVEERPAILNGATVDEWLEAKQIGLLTIRDISKVIDTVKAIAVPVKPEHAHLPEGHVIVNKRTGVCPLCLGEVSIGDGYAVHTHNGWKNYHRLGECLNLDDAIAGIADGYYAFPSASGNNDLDFFRVHVKSGHREILRVIGGHPDRALGSTETKAVVERLTSCTPEELTEAQALFGREIGRCGKCGRHLTDESSRQRGLGPECASK
jgi:hypothetical protein